MRTALVHDYLNQAGGAERVVECLHEVFPQAPIFTSIYDKKRMPDIFRSMDVRTSFMQHLPLVMKHFKKYLPLFPFAFESFNLSGYDLVLSSSSAWGKGIRKGKGATHICYCHSPMRFVWMYEDYMEKEGYGPLVRKVLPPVLRWLRKWDIKTSKGVDHFIANSRTTQKRIKLFYGRDSEVIHPPVDTSFFKPYNNKIKDYFLVVSRLNPYKHIDLAVETFNELGLPLYVIGAGPDEKRLKALAMPNIKFLGRLPDSEIVKHYSQCRAFILPGEEDFGLTPVEAQACGRPVIAYRAGGAQESVIEGRTGVFFDKQEKGSLADAIRKFNSLSFDPAVIRENALRFDKNVFERKIKEFVDAKSKQAS
jgi:glycosyltransferase involved in cell wall biosynthesis